MEYIQEYLKESDKLAHYANMTSMVTNYRIGLIDIGHYTRLSLKAEKEVKEMQMKEEVIKKIVEEYFNSPEKSLVDILAENIELIPSEHRKKFLEKINCEKVGI